VLAYIGFAPPLNSTKSSLIHQTKLDTIKPELYKCDSMEGWSIYENGEYLHTKQDAVVLPYSMTDFEIAQDKYKESVKLFKTQEDE